MKRGIVDVSNIIWTNLKGGKDTEFGQTYVQHNDTLTPMRSFQAKAYKDANPEAKIHLVNSAEYGYENAVKCMVQAMEKLDLQPRDLILVKEGMNSKSARQIIHPGYKGGSSKLEPEYAQFVKCRDMFIEVFLKLGANVAWQDNIESDDVMGYLAQNLRGERYIISNDKDLAVLVNKAEGVHHYRMGQLDKNPFGDFDHKLITMYIALVGDQGDKIPGAKGFGDSGELSAWKKLWITFGDDGLVAMDLLIQQRRLKDLEEDVGELPVLQKIIDDADNVYMSYELARLMVERVNTARRPLQMRAGMVMPKSVVEDERLQKYAGVNRIVCAENLGKSVEWIMRQIQVSPYIGLDIETSSSDESDAWIEAMDKDEDKAPVDVLGAELTSLQLTFGPNMQFSAYFPIDNVEEEGCSNISIADMRDVLAQIPREKVTYIHNAQFELPVCYQAWGEDWKNDDLYHGFLPNVRDTVILSSYADENRSAGLKNLSKTVLGYEQASYQDTVTKQYDRVVEYRMVDGEEHSRALEDQYPGYGRVKSVQRPDREDEEVTEWTENQVLVVEHKMNQLTAREVLGYGCDDTICTVALANQFQIVMELENTWDQYLAVEVWTTYVQALGFIHGSAFSLERMSEMEKKDRTKHDAAWVVLRQYLIDIGYEGTTTPTVVSAAVYDSMKATALADALEENPDLDPKKWKWTPHSHLIGFNAAGIKRMFQIVTGAELSTRVSTPSKLAKLVEQWAEENDGHTSAYLLAEAIKKEDFATINQLLEDNFTGEPLLDLNSPKQMAELLYDRMSLPVNVTNKITDIEKAKVPGLFEAMNNHRQWRLGKLYDLTAADWKLVRRKAKADDKAIQYALNIDVDYIDDAARKALKALGVMKKYLTRNQLFYKNYWKTVHWKTKRVHSNIRQCGTVTRRPTASMPNLYQLPKKGEGVEFRTCFVPHHKDAVVGSIDFDSQELRLGADRSQDKNMLACFVGDSLKGMHNLTASGAMKTKWSKETVQEVYDLYGPKPDDMSQTEYDYLAFTKAHELGKDRPLGKMADDLRKEAKNVNFLAQFGGQAIKLADMLGMKPNDTQAFLDARSAKFPDVDRAAKRAEDACYKTGYAVTYMGVRRHLREAILSDNRQIASRAARQAWNMEIQGSAGEMTKLAMSRLWTTGALFRYDVRFFASIYDELVVSVHKDHCADFMREMQECMTQPYSTMTVPILGSISIGPDFGNQIECGTEFSLEKINAALAKIFHKQEATA